MHSRENIIIKLNIYLYKSKSCTYAKWNMKSSYHKVCHKMSSPYYELNISSFNLKISAPVTLILKKYFCIKRQFDQLMMPETVQMLLMILWLTASHYVQKKWFLGDWWHLAKRISYNMSWVNMLNGQHSKVRHQQHKHTYVVKVHWNCSSVLPPVDCNIHQHSLWKFKQHS